MKPLHLIAGKDDLIPEMQWAKDKIKCDADIRSMCSAGFAEAFFWNNR